MLDAKGRKLLRIKKQRNECVVFGEGKKQDNKVNEQDLIVR